MDIIDATTNGLVNEKRAAQILGCSFALLRKWRRKRRGPVFCKIGRNVRYQLSELDAYIKSCRVEV